MKVVFRALSVLLWVTLFAFVVIDYFLGVALELGTGSGRHALEVVIAASLYCGATYFAGRAENG